MTQQQEGSADTPQEKTSAEHLAEALSSGGTPEASTPEASEKGADSSQESPSKKEVSDAFEVDLGDGVKRTLTMDEARSLIMEREGVEKEKQSVEAARREMRQLFEQFQSQKQPQKNGESDDEDVDLDDLLSEKREQRSRQQQAQQAALSDEDRQLLAELKNERIEQSRRSYVDDAIDKFEVLRDNPGHRDFAVRAIYDSMTANPQQDINRLAAEYANLTHKALSKEQPKPSAQRDSRGRSEILSELAPPTSEEYEDRSLVKNKLMDFLSKN